MRLQKDLIETAMNIALNEAQEGDLHNHLRMEISKMYGIDPNHRDWSKVGSHADIESYASAVYNQFPNEIDAVHGPDHARAARELGGLPVPGASIENDFIQNVFGIHKAYHNR